MKMRSGDCAVAMPLCGLFLAALAVLNRAQDAGFAMVLNNPSVDNVELFWVSPDVGRKEVSMGVIDASASMNVNTFNGHTFGWRKSSDKSSVKLKMFTVDTSMEGTQLDLPGISSGADEIADEEDIHPPAMEPPVSWRKARTNKKRKRQSQGAGSKGIGGLSFRNLCNRPLILYWKNVNTGDYKFQGQLGPGEQTGFQTYPGHQFIWSEVHSDPPVPLQTFQIDEETLVYPFVDSTTTKKALDELNKELDFREEYYEKNGFDWIGTTYPRPPVTLYMHRPKYIGEKFSVQINDTGAYHYTCPEDNFKDCLQKQSTNHADLSIATQEGPESLELEVMSTHPRVFRIKNFLSEFECDYIINQATPKLHRSTTGHGKNTRVDDVRTSKSAWLTRGEGNVMDAIYRRIGQAANIPQELVTESNIAENLNVLNYGKGSEYTPHYDVGADGKIASRWLSGLLYLNTPEGGGGTSFPKALMEDGSLGTSVNAEKGAFVFFYSLLEDGNVDMRSLHSGMKVNEGEKWVSPLWLWEPSRTGAPHGMGDLSSVAQLGPLDETSELDEHDEL